MKTGDKIRIVNLEGTGIEDYTEKIGNIGTIIDIEDTPEEDLPILVDNPTGMTYYFQRANLELVEETSAEIADLSVQNHSALLDLLHQLESGAVSAEQVYEQLLEHGVQKRVTK